MLIGFIAMLVVAALSQFGVQLNTRSDREVHRITDCDDAPQPAALVFRVEEKSC